MTLAKANAILYFPNLVNSVKQFFNAVLFDSHVKHLLKYQRKVTIFNCFGAGFLKCSTVASVVSKEYFVHLTVCEFLRYLFR